MQLLPLVVLLAVFPVLVSLMWTFDRLVRLEFEKFPENWTADGRPYPLLWKRRDMPRTIRSWLATQRCALVWPFVVPEWSYQDAEALRYARRLRVLFALWILVALPLFALSGIIAIAAS